MPAYSISLLSPLISLEHFLSLLPPPHPYSIALIHRGRSSGVMFFIHFIPFPVSSCDIRTGVFAFQSLTENQHCPNSEAKQTHKTKKRSAADPTHSWPVCARLIGRQTDGQAPMEMANAVIYGGCTLAPLDCFIEPHEFAESISDEACSITSLVHCRDFTASVCDSVYRFVFIF